MKDWRIYQLTELMVDETILTDRFVAKVSAETEIEAMEKYRLGNYLLTGNFRGYPLWKVEHGPLGKKVLLGDYLRSQIFADLGSFSHFHNKIAWHFKNWRAHKDLFGGKDMLGGKDLINGENLMDGIRASNKMCHYLDIQAIPLNILLWLCGAPSNPFFGHEWEAPVEDVMERFCLIHHKPTKEELHAMEDNINLPPEDRRKVFYSIWKRLTTP